MLDWMVSPPFLVSSNVTSGVREVSDFALTCVGSKISSLVSITMEGLRSQSGDSCSWEEGSAGGVAGERAERIEMAAGGRKCMDCKEQEQTKCN